jgi:hypothetical protein
MAARNKVAKKRPQTTPTNKILIKLSGRAMREANALLKHSEAGTITKAQLSSGLKQLEVPLQQMVGYLNTTIKDVSKLRSDADALGTPKLNIELKKVRKKVNRLLDHSGPGPHT